MGHQTGSLKKDLIAKKGFILKTLYLLKAFVENIFISLVHILYSF